jgi:hypothetical protein
MGQTPPRLITELNTARKEKTKKPIDAAPPEVEPSRRLWPCRPLATGEIDSDAAAAKKLDHLIPWNVMRGPICISNESLHACMISRAAAAA